MSFWCGNNAAISDGLSDDGSKVPIFFDLVFELPVDPEEHQAIALGRIQACHLALSIVAIISSPGCRLLRLVVPCRAF